jgi:outer membrane protein
MTLITTALLLAVSAGGAFAANASLEKLITRAQDSNPLIQATHEKVVRAQEALNEATANMGPKAGAAMGALWGTDDYTISPSGLPVAAGTSSMVRAKCRYKWATSSLGYKNTYVSAIGFIQAIYTGGSLQALKQSKQLALEAAKAEEARVRQGVTNGVQTSYYNRKRAEEKQVVAEEAVSLTKDHMDRAQKLFNAGVVAKSDVLRSKVAVSDAELNLIRAKNAVELTLTAIEKAVGDSVSSADVSDGLPPRASSTLRREIQETPKNALDIAYEKREELKMYSLLSQQAEKVAKAAKGQLLPQIVGAAGFYTVDDSFFPTDNSEFKVGLAATWTLYDSGRVKAKTNQAKAQARELLRRLDDMKTTVKLEVTQAELNLRSAESRLNVAEHQVQTSEEDYRIAKRRYDESVGTNLDVLDARLALTNSRTELVDALYDIQIAQADLRYAMGAN